MEKEQMSKRIQHELAEYRALTTDEEKAAFWKRVQTLDATLSTQDRLLINEVIYEDLQATIAVTKELLGPGNLVKINA